MKKIHDAQQLSAYIDTFSLQNYLDAALSDMAVLHSFDKDERLIQTGTVSDYLYFLVEGTVMVYSYPSDTQNIFYRLCQTRHSFRRSVLFMGNYCQKQCKGRDTLYLRVHFF